MDQQTARDTPRSARRGRFRLGAVLALALAAAFVAWYVVSDNDDDGGAASGSETTAARAATEDELAEVAESLDYPVYWAGPISGHTYELTKTAAGRVYVRYLPEGVEVGDPRPRYLTVGTYPQANGYAAVQTASERPNTVSKQAEGGALVVADNRRPRSVYFSFPKARFQVEVYDPEPGRARELTYSGQIQRLR